MPKDFNVTFHKVSAVALCQPRAVNTWSMRETCLTAKSRKCRRNKSTVEKENPMKNRRLPLLVCASLVSALSLSAVSLPSASAQPAAGKTGRKARAAGTRGGVPKRMMEKIEAQMGKPLTEDQKTRLNTAYRTRAAARKELDAKFAAEVGNVTGMTADQVKDLNKRGPRAGGAAKAAQN
jgi:hypothetical protein